MVATPDKSLGSLASYSVAYLAGAWLLDYLVKDTPVRPLGAVISLIFAGLFLYLWAVPEAREEDATNAVRPAGLGRAVCEALANVWAITGFAAFLVWFWFVDGKQVGLDAMGRAEGWHQALFWGMIGLGLVLGCYGGLRRVANRHSREPNRDKAVDSAIGGNADSEVEPK